MKNYLIIFLSLIIVSCGGGGGGSAPTPNQGSTSTPTTVPTTTPATPSCDDACFQANKEEFEDCSIVKCKIDSNNYIKDCNRKCKAL